MKKNTKKVWIVLGIIAVIIVFFLIRQSIKPLTIIGAVNVQTSLNNEIPIRPELISTLPCSINDPQGFNQRSGKILFGDGIIESSGDNRPYLQVQVNPYYSNFFDPSTKKDYYSIYDVLYRNADTGQKKEYLLTVLDDNIMRATPSMDNLSECQDRRCQIYFNVYYCPFDYTPKLDIPLQDITSGLYLRSQPVITQINPSQENQSQSVAPVPDENLSGTALLSILGLLVLITVLIVIYIKTKRK